MDSDQGRRLKKIVFMAIVLGLFTYLVVYIYSSGVSIYKASKTEAEKQKAESLDCTIYSFSVLEETVRYSEGNLEFTIRNTIGEPFDVLVVDVDGKIHQYGLQSFTRNSPPQKIIVENIESALEVSAYPKGCLTAAREIPVRN